MEATTWMTGREAAALKLVDVILDDVALSAYQPLKRVTAAHKPPAQITALIDTAPVSPPARITPSIDMKATPELIATAAAFGITLTAASDEAAVTAALATISAAAPKTIVPPAPAGPVTLEQITAAITGAVKPLDEKITAQAKEITHLKGLREQGLGTPDSPTAAAPVAITGAAPKVATLDTSKMTAAQLIHLGRTQLMQAGAVTAQQNPALAA